MTSAEPADLLLRSGPAGTEAAPGRRRRGPGKVLVKATTRRHCLNGAAYHQALYRGPPGPDELAPSR
jgi:hypothetical protein